VRGISTNCINHSHPMQTIKWKVRNIPNACNIPLRASIGPLHVMDSRPPYGHRHGHIVIPRHTQIASQYQKKSCSHTIACGCAEIKQGGMPLHAHTTTVGDLRGEDTGAGVACQLKHQSHQSKQRHTSISAHAAIRALTVPVNTASAS